MRTSDMKDSNGRPLATIIVTTKGGVEHPCVAKLDEIKYFRDQVFRWRSDEILAFPMVRKTLSSNPGNKTKSYLGDVLFRYHVCLTVHFVPEEGAVR